MLSSVTFYIFCINNPLKHCQYSALLIACFKFFCINKTLKHINLYVVLFRRFESFRINKTLKPQIRFSPSLTIQRQMAVNMIDLICKGLYPE